jgi:threonine synthase
MVLGLAHGFGQLLQSGLIEKLPRIVGVQATRCAPLVQAYHDHSQGLQPVIAGPTEADGIAIGHPIRWRQILAAIRKSDGLMTEVSEAAIRSALRHWAGRGWLMEPTSATALAAFDDLAAAGAFVAQDTVIIPVTGSGAKLASRNFGAGT